MAALGAAATPNCQTDSPPSQPDRQTPKEQQWKQRENKEKLKESGSDCRLRATWYLKCNQRKRLLCLNIKKNAKHIR